MSDSLQTGKFYGKTRRRFELGGVVLTEVSHACGRKLPCHTHESAYFGLLLAGSYATVHFQIAQSAPSLLVPSSALLVDAQGMRVAVVDGDHRLHYRPVQIGRDLGQEVEILSGVAEGDVLASGLSAAIADGSAIEVAKPAGVTGK